MQIPTILGFRAPFITLLGTLAACGGGGGGSPGPTPISLISLDSLSGYIRTTGGAPLQDATVSLEADSGILSALTDDTGAFIIASIGTLPGGTVQIDIDGSTAQATGPLAFPHLSILVSLPPGTTDLSLPQVITLPDLNNSLSANQSLALSDVGEALVPIDVVQAGGLSSIALTGPAGTILNLPGLPVGATGVDLNVTPVAPAEVPMPLPGGLVGSSFVTIQPGNASFDPPGDVAGLDIVLPDDLGLAPGTLVDIWSFDIDAGEWVNRTEQTGQTGVVQLVGGTGPGTEIVASGVITEGGWQTAAIVVDPACATNLVGSVINSTTGAGIAGATIAISTGQFAVTDVDGNFTQALVPAYNTGLLTSDRVCVAASLTFEVVLPQGAGGLSSGPVFVSAGSINTGATTTLEPVSFELDSTGSVSGIVIGEGAPGAAVTLAPPIGEPIEVVPNENGSFFSTGLEEGQWTASFLFLGDAAPTVVAFAIVANSTTDIVIQASRGGGNGTITVLVLEDDDNMITALTPAVGARVRLQGTDAGSSAGLVMLTDASGRAVFNSVTGPFSVTAQRDVTQNGITTRFASSLVDVSGSSGTIGVLLDIGSVGDIPIADAELTGTIANLPPVATSEFVLIQAIERGVTGGFSDATTVNPIDGTYSIPIPSGLLIDVTVTHFSPVASSQIKSTLFAPASGPATSGGNLTLNFDLANAVPWQQSVGFTFSNFDPAGPLLVGALLTDTTSGSLNFMFIHNGPGVPASLSLELPNFASPAFAGFDVRLIALAGPDSAIRKVNATPAGLAFEFIRAPLAVNPQDGDSFSLSELETLNVLYTESNTGTFGTNGANTLELYYDAFETNTAPQGIDQAFWSIIVPAGDNAFDLPKTALPMFAQGQQGIRFGLDMTRFKGLDISLENFFNENLAANQAALNSQMTQQSTSLVEGLISTQ